MTKNLAYSLMRHKIRVNQVSPGWMDTESEDTVQRRFHGATDGWLERAEAEQPTGRLIKPPEVAKVVTFYLSDESGMLTGNIVDYDQSVQGAGDAPETLTPGDSAVTVKIGVLGVGRIGKMHAELVARQVSGCGSLAMVQDINADAAAAVGEQLDVPHTTDVDALLGSGDVDAVAICSSTDTHVPLLIAAARAGKAIFCEKPDLARSRQGRRGPGGRHRAATCPSRSVSTVASIRPTLRYVRPWSTDPWATCTSCASPVATRRRRRSPTSKCRVDCSST